MYLQTGCSDDNVQLKICILHLVSINILNITFFFQLLKHNFVNRAQFSKPLHTISTTPHQSSTTPQMICKMEHFCQNYSMSYKNPSNGLILFESVKHSCAQPKTLLAFTQRQCKKYIHQHHMTPIVQSNTNMYIFSCIQVSHS